MANQAKYDIIIIGSGPGGYVAAERAGHLGKKVLIIEKAKLGGVCLNWGCIPTKSLLNSAKTYRHALEAEKYGVKVSGVQFDLAAAMAWKERTVATLQKGIAYLMKKNKVDVLEGTAKIVAPGEVDVDGTRYRCDNIIIATGSRAAVPPIPGADQNHVVTNRGALTLETLPETVAVIGGGVIGMEFASFFSSLGKNVEVFEMLPEILPMMESTLAGEMRKAMKDVVFHTSTRVQAIDGKTVRYSDPDGAGSLEADLVLMAVGRIPNTADLGLEELRIDVTGKGIGVDEHMRTNIPGIYAIGDVTGTSLLAHSASRMGEVAVNHICGIKDRMRYDAIPWAVYTAPEAAGCGMTLAQAKEAGFDARLLSYAYRANGRNLAENGAGAGMSLQVVDNATGRILGVHLLGAYASENIAAAAVMLETDVRTRELQQIVFPHPTVSEVIREAAFEF
jgi:dihydrolipoamide dehydrogenase